MPEIHASTGFDIESLVNQAAGDFAKGDLEDKRVDKAKVRVHTNKLHDKREERIKNLTDQIKGVSAGGGKCFKFLKVVFKIFDFLAKPISALTLNKLKIDLSKTLDMLKDSKTQQALLGLKIKGEDIMKVIEGLKKTLGNDMESLKTVDQRSAKETQRVLQILDEIHESFQATMKV